MSQMPAVKGSGSARLALCILFAAPLLTLPILAEESAAGGVSVASQPAKASNLDMFVLEVGIDMSTVPTEIRSQWASGPRVGLDDCGMPGTHAAHHHGDENGESSLSGGRDQVE